MIGLLLALQTSAYADDPLWWSEEGISSQSELFGKAQARDADAFERAQQQLDTAKRQVGDLELGVALLGGSETTLAYAESLDRQLSGQFLRLQKHVDLLGADYARVFGAALDRSLPFVAGGKTVTQCQSRSQVEAMMGRGPRCPGIDISAKLAAKMDQDTVLASEIAEILSLDWPAISVEGAPQDGVVATGSERSVDAAALARVVYKEELRSLDDARDIAIEELSEDLDGADREAKAAAIQAAAAAKERWRQGVAQLGGKLRTTAKKTFEKAQKKGGPAAVSLCANPVGLGGCGMEDTTSSALALFRE